MLIVMADLRCGILLDVNTRARAVLATASGTHFVHDGFSDILYVLLPVWAQEFRLNLAQVGLIRTAYTAAMASFQIPAGLLAERWGERRLLAAGGAAAGGGGLTTGAGGGGVPPPPRAPPIPRGRGGGPPPPPSSPPSGRRDTAPRRVPLPFLPSALAAKGPRAGGVGPALALLSAGGPIGRFVWGLVGEGVGVTRGVVLAEPATAGGIALVVLVPLPVAL